MQSKGLESVTHDSLMSVVGRIMLHSQYCPLGAERVAATRNLKLEVA